MYLCPPSVRPSSINLFVFFFQTPFSELKPWNLKPNLGGKLYIYPPSRSTISPDHLFFQNLFIYFFIIFFKFSFNMKTYGSKNVKRHPWKYTSDSLPKKSRIYSWGGFLPKMFEQRIVMSKFQIWIFAIFLCSLTYGTIWEWKFQTTSHLTVYTKFPPQNWCLHMGRVSNKLLKNVKFEIFGIFCVLFWPFNKVVNGEV